MSAHRYPWAEVGPKESGCSPFKVVRELGLNVVRQFGPYLPWALENSGAAPVREDRSRRNPLVFGLSASANGIAR